MVLEDVQAVVIGALDGHARPDDFRKTVNIERLNAAFDFDMAAHRFGPRLGAEDADAQRQFADVDAEFRRALNKVDEIAGRAADGGDAEISSSP